MPKNTYKRSRITEVGFIFQDLYCFKLLLEEYQNNFERVKYFILECQDKDKSGIDDIVKEYENGSCDCYQVKFTVDDERYAVSWNWLLEAKNNKNSIFDKLIKNFDNITVNKIILVTNKSLCDDFRLCLNTGEDKVIFDNIDKENKSKVLSKFKNEEQCKKFFAKFEILIYEGSEISLRQEIIENLEKKISFSEDDFLRIFDYIKRIAIGNFDKDCKKDKIDYELFNKILNNEIKLLNQNFHIPYNYRVPDLDFHNNLLNEIKNNSGFIKVISGTPGVGKSTYLSNLCNNLLDSGIICIRHHYYLSNDDTNSNERFSYSSIKHSLINTVKKYFKDIGDVNITLKDILSKINEKVVIIIDGLDHVWRSKTDPNLRMINLLFNDLIPVNQNVILIIGTQNIEDKYLPTQLINYLDRENWLKMPNICQDNFKDYLNENEYYKTNDNILINKIYEKTNGYPLYLIYILKYLKEKEAQPNILNELNKFNTIKSDISIYYKSLFSQLSQLAKNMLFVYVASDFVVWPIISFKKCFESFGKIEIINVLEEIKFLFDIKQDFIKLFHESLKVFIRGNEDYCSNEIDSVKILIEWLESINENDELYFYKWKYLWAFKIKIGENIDDKLDVLNRNWVIESIKNGFKPSDIVCIIDKFELYAFEKEKYSKCVELRYLKTKLINFDHLNNIDCTESLYENFIYKNNYSLKLDLYNLEISNKNLISIIRYLYNKKDLKTIEEIYELLRKDIIRRIKLVGENEDYRVGNLREILEMEIDSFIETGIILDCSNEMFIETLNMENGFDRNRRIKSSLNNYCSICFRYRKYKNIKNLLNSNNEIIIENQNLILDWLLKIIILDGGNTNEYIDNFIKLNDYSLLLCNLINNKIPYCQISDFNFNDLSHFYMVDREYSVFDKNISLCINYVKNLFFCALYYFTTEQANYFFYNTENILDFFNKNMNLDISNYRLHEVAEKNHFNFKHNEVNVAGLFFLNREIIKIAYDIFSVNYIGEQFDATVIFRYFDNYRGNIYSARNSIFTRSINTIFTYLQFIYKTKISEKNLFEIYDLQIFDKEYFLNNLIIYKDIFGFDGIFVSKIIEKEVEIIKKCRSDTEERKTKYLLLLNLAKKYELDDKIKYLENRLIKYLIGYSNHKDEGLHRTLKSIEYCINNLNHTRNTKITDWLNRIFPFIVNYFSITDGKGRGIRVQFAEVLNKYDTNLYEKYRNMFTIEEREYLDSEVANNKVENKDSGLSDNSEAKNINYQEYGPNIDSFEYLANLGKKYLEKWFQFWKQQDSDKLLEFFNGIQFKELLDVDFKHYLISNILDEIFKLSLEKKGKEESFYWLITSHKHNYGWSPYWSRGYEYRIKISAKYYDNRHIEYLNSTCKTDIHNYENDNNLIVGVLYFLELGKTDIAYEIVDSLLNEVESELFEYRHIL